MVSPDKLDRPETRQTGSGSLDIPMLFWSGLINLISNDTNMLLSTY